jgi:hypothetical protein
MTQPFTIDDIQKEFEENHSRLLESMIRLGMIAAAGNLSETEAMRFVLCVNECLQGGEVSEPMAKMHFKMQLLAFASIKAAGDILAEAGKAQP